MLQGPACRTVDLENAKFRAVPDRNTKRGERRVDGRQRKPKGKAIERTRRLDEWPAPESKSERGTDQSTRHEDGPGPAQGTRPHSVVRNIDNDGAVAGFPN